MSQGIEINVEDTGIVINQSLNESIFEEFRQIDGSTTRAVGGMRMGLFASMSLADMLKA